MSANAAALPASPSAPRRQSTPSEAIVSACAPCTFWPLSRTLPSSSTASTTTSSSAMDRPFSPKHHMLRPSGPIGLYLGFMGVALFLGIFLYPIRKHWAWLRQIGNTRHWLDIHVLMGLTAPFIIAFHSTLKFKGIAGMAFWIMFAVSVSGVVGRYLYAQIPRKGHHRRNVDERIAGIAGEPVPAIGLAEAACPRPICGRCCACPTRNRSRACLSRSLWST